MGTLLKLSLSLTKMICQDPKFIQCLVQQAEGLASSIKPPDPPPHPPSSSAGHVAPATKTVPKEHAVTIPSTSADVHPPSTPSKAHHKTLEFITEAAHELYAHGQLHIKPYAGYLRKERQHVTPSIEEDKLA